MGRLVTESGMWHEASTLEAKAWKASASLICSVKPTCWLVMSRYTWIVELYTVSLVT